MHDRQRRHRRRGSIAALALVASFIIQQGAGNAAPEVAAQEGVSSLQPQSSKEVYELHLAVDIPVTIAGGALTLARELFARRLVVFTCPCDPSGVNGADRWAIGYHNHAAALASDISLYGVPLLLPLIDLADLGLTRALAEDLAVFAETLAVDAALRNIVDFATARPRPLTYAGDPVFLRNPEGYLSFYAGHVATVVAALSAASYTVRRRYGEQVWPWIVTALVGASVAAERVAAGLHFPTDVVAGAAVGAANGVTIPWLHARRSRAPVPIALVPFGAGLGLVGAF
jgi:membrane-associated phospholipid phosphatase